MRRVDSLEKTLMLGGIGGRRKRGRQRMRWLDGITVSMGVCLGELWDWDGVAKSQTRMSDWTELNWILYCVYVPQLSYPFVCWWTSRLLPCPGYCKQSCDEQWGTYVSFNSGFLGAYAQQWHCWVIWQF